MSYWVSLALSISYKSELTSDLVYLDVTSDDSKATFYEIISKEAVMGSFKNMNVWNREKSALILLIESVVVVTLRSTVSNVISTTACAIDSVLSETMRS